MKRTKHDPECPGCAALRAELARKEAISAQLDERKLRLERELAEIRQRSSRSPKAASGEAPLEPDK